MNTEIIKFDYTKETLEKMRDDARSINLSDKSQIENTIKILVKARGIIQKQGKSYRDEANAYNKAVLQKEKEYLEIIEPLEIEYKEKIIHIEKEEIRQARLLVLPQRKNLLAMLTKINQRDDEFILSLDDVSFMSYLSERQIENQKNIDLENQRIEREKLIAENAKKEAEENAKKQIEEANFRAERAIQEEKNKIEREKLAEEKKQKELGEEKIREQEKLEKNKKYKKFLSDNGYTEENKNDYITKETENEYVLFKKISTLKK